MGCIMPSHKLTAMYLLEHDTNENVHTVIPKTSKAYEQGPTFASALRKVPES